MEAKDLAAATDRELFRRVWSLSWPTVLYCALEACLGLADLVMVRSLGPEATAAVGVSRQVLFLVDAIVLALVSGVIAVVSQAVGGNRWHTVGQVLRQIMLLALMTALLIGVLGALGAGRILTALNADQPTLSQATPYLQVSFLGLVFGWASLVGASFSRSWGDAVTPLKLASLVACLNIPLNYLLIHGNSLLPALGVEGAAIGTIAAQFCGAAGYFVLLTRRTALHPEMKLGAGKVFAFDWQLVSRILRIGTPMALAGLVRNGSRLMFLMIVGGGAMGMTMHAAVGAGLQVQLIIVLPALAFHVATAALVGQAIGRGDVDEIRRLSLRSVQLLALIMLGIVAVIILCAKPLAQFLIVDSEVSAVAATVLRWFAVAQFFGSLSITVQGALMGAGDTLPNLRYTIFTQWLVMLPLTLLATTTNDWQLHGPLIAWTIAHAILLVLLMHRLRSKDWKTIDP